MRKSKKAPYMGTFVGEKEIRKTIQEPLQIIFIHGYDISRFGVGNIEVLKVLETVSYNFVDVMANVLENGGDFGKAILPKETVCDLLRLTVGVDKMFQNIEKKESVKNISKQISQEARRLQEILDQNIKTELDSYFTEKENFLKMARIKKQFCKNFWQNIAFSNSADHERFI